MTEGRIRLMRFALDGDSQINFARRIVCNPANENGDGHCEGPSPFEHRNERMNSMIFEALLEHMPIRLSVTGVCKVSFTFAFGYRFEKRGYGFPKPLNGARLCFA